jgi:hypothetical protein
VQKGSGLKFISVSALAVIGGGAAIASASGAPAAHSAAAAGGLSITPALIEAKAAAGAGGAVTIANHSTQKLEVTVAARPWKQAAGGAVSPNRRATLADVGLSDRSFALAPGQQQKVAVALRSAKTLYGALDVVGLPPDAATRKGVVVGYRLIGSLRMDPATPVLKLRTAAIKAVGGQLVLPTTNRGNTILPVSGTADLKGALGTRSTSVKSMRILPGETVNLPLGATRALPAGAYTAKIVLKQGKQRTTVTRHVRVKR